MKNYGLNLKNGKINKREEMKTKDQEIAALQNEVKDKVETIHKYLNQIQNLQSILTRLPNHHGLNYIHNEIIERISYLTIDCPECESIIGSDDQYTCTTRGSCSGDRNATINVYRYLSNHLK